MKLLSMHCAEERGTRTRCGLGDRGTHSARLETMYSREVRAGDVSRPPAQVALALAWVAGGVDAIGYITLSHLFTAHMSGNSVAVGAAIGQTDWSVVLERGVPIVLFMVGIGVGAAIGEMRQAHAARHPFAAVYAAEAALLAAFWILGNQSLPSGHVDASAGWLFYALAALPTLAMGLQNATLRQVGKHGVHTTYVSGVLTSLAEALAQLFFRREWLPADPPQERVMLYGGLWVAYLAGAVLDSFGQARWGFSALVLPIGGLGFVAVRDVLAPQELGNGTPPSEGTA